MPRIQPKPVVLAFDNKDAIPKKTTVLLHRDAVAPVMAWYGAYFAGDRYTVTINGEPQAIDQNGEPVAP